MLNVPITARLLSDRKIEVNIYIEFLKIAVERPAILTAKDGQLELPMSMQLTHTLKANLLLLLYSAMEAALIQLLDEMHDAINNNCVSVDTLNAQVLRRVLKAYKRSTNSLDLELNPPLRESLFQAWISGWMNRASGKEKRDGGISGSVDSLVFYRQLREFDVVAKTINDKPPAHLTHFALQSVKGKRNELAHGEKSFVDMGRDLSVEELERDAIAVFTTLTSIAGEIDAYLDQKRYLSISAAGAITT